MRHPDRAFMSNSRFHISLILQQLNTAIAMITQTSVVATNAVEHPQTVARKQDTAANPGSFPQFQKLPAELRLWIWELAATPYRVHYFYNTGHAVSVATLSNLFGSGGLLTYAEAASHEDLSLSSPHVNANLDSSNGRPQGGVIVTTNGIKLGVPRSLGCQAIAHQRRAESKRFAGIYKDYVECKKGLIHVNSEAREAITRLRPPSATCSLDLRAIAHHLVPVHPDQFALDLSLPRSLVSYHPENDIFVYEAARWIPFHMSLQTEVRHIKRVAITYSGMLPNLLQLAANNLSDPAELTAALRNWRTAIRRQAGDGGGRAILEHVWKTNHPDLTDVDLVVTYTPGTFAYHRLQRVFKDGTVDLAKLLDNDVCVFNNDDGFLALEACGEEWNAAGMLTPFVFWLMFGKMFDEYLPNVNVRLRFAAEENLRSIVSNGLQ